MGKVLVDPIRNAMRILITGATGFIGRKVLGALTHDRTASIVVVGRSAPAPLPSGSEHVTADLSVPGWIDELKGPADVVLHLAQSRRYRDFPDGVKDMVAVNIDATVALADWARRNGVRRFLFASSGTVYPADAERPLRENDVARPASMYGASKLSAELLLEQYAGAFEIVLMRMFAVYGPGQRDMLIPSMVQRLLDGSAITLAGGVGIRLNPLFLTDCVAMIQSLVSASLSGPVERLNLAGAEETSLAQIVTLLETLLGRRANVAETDGRPPYLVGSIEKVRELTKRDSFVPLREGLRRTLVQLTK